jgi:hypothetical protein
METPMNRDLFAKLSAALLATTLAACGSESSGNLTISARAATAGAASAGSTRNALVVGGFTIERVRMVIRDIQLEQEGQDEVDASNGPFLIDLAGSDLDGGVTEQFSVEVPPGDYDDLRFVVHKLEDLERTGDAEIDAIRASIIIDYSIDGAQGRFTSDLNERQRIFGNFAVSEGGTLDNVTLVIDPSGWFAGGLDPRDPADKQAIEAAIQASIDAFEDDDRNGSDDGPNHT